MRIKLIVLFCLLLTIPFSGCSTKTVKQPEKSKTDYAKEIIELTDVKKTVDQVIMQLDQMQGSMLTQMGISGDEKEKAMEFQKKFQATMLEVLDFEKMEPDYIDLFVSVYTLEELKGITDFYKSPVGKSMVQKQPQVLKKSMEISQSRLQILIPKLQKIAAEMKQDK